MTPRSDLIVEAMLGDITVQRVDAVVNAANRQLAGGGGVDGAIHRAAGAAALQSACRAIGECPPGRAVATDGFNLAAPWIIHTVGPVWQGGGRGEADILASCYRSCLSVADRLEARSLAFPAISTGSYGYPAGAAAAIALASVRHTPSRVTLVRFIAFDQATLALYEDLL
jgi:O-acetyl-ADP-ribose deacetylase (regulator of RNase III)